MTGRHKAIRLPPLKTLRVHNPKRQVENPCIAIMSSVLGTNSPPIRRLLADLGWHTDNGYSVLGLSRLQRNGLRSSREPAPQMHGRSGSSPRGHEYD